MPTYEYECTECNIRFEKFQSIKDDPLTECPECKGRVKRLISAGVGIIFKGSGFYTTDYKKSSATSSTPSTSSSNGSSGDKKTDKKSETKSETKKEVKKETASTPSSTSSST
jgi:putative FmdB family regulatory protein